MEKLKRSLEFTIIAGGLAYFAMPVQPAQATLVTRCGDVTEANAYQKTKITSNGITNKAYVTPNSFGFVNCKRPLGTACVEPKMCLEIEDTNGEFKIVSNVWDSVAKMGYGAGQTDPLTYPMLLQGKNWDYNTDYSSGLKSLKVSQVNSWPIGRDTDSLDNADDAWNASLEWWFTTYDPSTKGTITQADATELMIWQDSFGLWNGSPVTPYGKSVGTVKIEGLEWEVIIGRAFWGNSTAKFWNYIAYRPANGARYKNLHVNAKAFFDNAKTQTGLNTSVDGDPNHSAHCKQGTSTGSNDTAPNGNCLYDDWYVMSVQAGFEVYIDGVGLKSTHYSSTVNGPNTSRTNDEGKPVSFWEDDLIISATGCPAGGGSATYQFTVENPAFSRTGSMDVPSPDNHTFVKNLGKPRFIASPLELHGNATITTTVSCGGGVPAVVTTTPIYIDPSGHVLDQNNKPIAQAKVTLYRSTGGEAGPYLPVTDGDAAVMSPGNRKNPDYTEVNGYYGWDVALNWYYKVRAEKPGCTSLADPAIPYAESPPMEIPPARTNVDLRLNCPVSGTNPVKIFNNWGTGYCANVEVTNTTGAPWVWTTTFTLDGTIYDLWNANKTLVGDQVTLTGVAWNRTLTPGATTQSVGFCANRTTTPPGAGTVVVTKTNDWGSGYCATVTVTNNTSSVLTWNVNIPREGTIYESWNGVFATGATTVNVKGVDWNKTLAPGASTHDVGYCANR